MDSQLTLTLQIEINDNIDKILLEDILLIVQNTDILSIVSYWSHQKFNLDKTDQEYLKKIMLSVNALVKANALRRNYHKIKDVLIKDVENDPTIKGTAIDMLFNKVDAFILIEAFFSQIKTSLDLLAQSIKPIYGHEFHTWAKKNELSGMEIVSVLKNNLKSDLKPHAEPIIKLIETHADSITRIINHRDDTVHYGKLNKVQGFRYSVSQNKVIPPLILVTDTQSAYVHEYLDEVLKYIADFIQEFVVVTLSNLMPDMVIARLGDGSWGWNTRSLNTPVK
jgi:hypothetical protein